MTELLNPNGTIPAATSGQVLHNISSSTNTSPISVTFTAPHGMVEGDTIEIEGHAVNTAANGMFQVHVTGASTVQLNGSTGNGVGGATGFAIDHSVGPLIQVNNDAEPANAGNDNTAKEGALLFVPYLYKRAGKYRVLYADQVGYGTIFTLFGTPSLNTSTWSDLGVTPLAGTRRLFQNDLLLLQATFAVLPGSGGRTGLAFGIAINGGAASPLSTFAMETLGDGTHIYPISLEATYFYPFAPGAAGDSFTISLMGLANSGITAVGVEGLINVSYVHMRSNA